MICSVVEFMEQPEKNPTISKRKNSLYEDFILRLDYIQKKITVYIDDVSTFFTEEIGLVGGHIAVRFSELFAWLLSTDRSKISNWPLLVVKAVIGLTFVFLVALPLFVCLFALGTFATLFGMRNIAHYSKKEQFAVYAILIVIFGMAPLFLSEYALFRFSLVLVYAVGVLGLDFLIGQCGIVSLASGGFLLTGGYVMTWLNTGMLGVKVPLYISLVLAAIFNGVLGALFGIPALRIKDHYLVIVSIAFTLSIPAILRSPFLITLSGSRQGGLFIDEIAVPEFLSKIPPHIFKYFVVVIPVLFLFYIAYNIIHHSQIGRAFKSIKCDNEVTMILGVPVVYYKLLAFAVSGVYAAFCGGFLVILTKFISPDSYGSSTSIDFLIANAVGGAGGILGSVFGGAFLAFEPDITHYVADLVPRGKDLARAAYGIILVLIILFAPHGVIGDFAKRLKIRFRPKTRRGAFMTSPPPDFDYLEEKKQYFPTK